MQYKTVTIGLNQLSTSKLVEESILKPIKQSIIRTVGFLSDFRLFTEPLVCITLSKVARICF